jgi:hypothetical protein
MANRDCILFHQEKGECKGLKNLECKNGGKCGFYKSNKQYHRDGSKRKYPIFEEQEVKA